MNQYKCRIHGFIKNKDVHHWHYTDENEKCDCEPVEAKAEAGTVFCTCGTRPISNPDHADFCPMHRAARRAPADCLCAEWVGKANPVCPVHGSPSPADAQ